MARNDSGFGRISGFDPRLLEDSGSCRQLQFRERTDDRLLFFTPQGRMVTLASASLGYGPDRILCDRVPDPGELLPIDGWSFSEAGFETPDGGRLPLADAPALRSDMLVPARDYPGHMRRILKRSMKDISREGAANLFELGNALQQPLAEIVEVPLLRVLGFDPDPGGSAGSETGERPWRTWTPAGDQALCGMLLTGRAFLLGKLLRIDWFGRLAMEIRRFQHRTTRPSSAHLRFAMEGRLTQAQEQFFAVLARDHEGAVEASWQLFRDSRDGGGPWFLAGVSTALEMIFQDLFRNMNRSGAGKPLSQRIPTSEPEE